MWAPVSNLSERNVTEGIIKLWHNQNVMQYSKWSTSGEFGIDVYYYFVVPAGFYMTGEDTFAFNFSFKFIKKPVDVYHSGIWKTEPFWRLEEQSPPEQSLQTDKELKLPYLIVPDLGQPNYYPERRYFIPLTVNL